MAEATTPSAETPSAPNEGIGVDEISSTLGAFVMVSPPGPETSSSKHSHLVLTRRNACLALVTPLDNLVYGHGDDQSPCTLEDLAEYPPSVMDIAYGKILPGTNAVRNEIGKVDMLRMRWASHLDMTVDRSHFSCHETRVRYDLSTVGFSARCCVIEIDLEPVLAAYWARMKDAAAVQDADVARAKAKSDESVVNAQNRAAVAEEQGNKRNAAKWRKKAEARAKPDAWRRLLTSTQYHDPSVLVLATVPSKTEELVLHFKLGSLKPMNQNRPWFSLLYGHDPVHPTLDPPSITVLITGLTPTELAGQSKTPTLRCCGDKDASEAVSQMTDPSTGDSGPIPADASSPTIQDIFRHFTNLRRYTVVGAVDANPAYLGELGGKSRADIETGLRSCFGSAYAFDGEVEGPDYNGVRLASARLEFLTREEYITRVGQERYTLYTS